MRRQNRLEQSKNVKMKRFKMIHKLSKEEKSSSLSQEKKTITTQLNTPRISRIGGMQDEGNKSVRRDSSNKYLGGKISDIIKEARIQ